jgi:hypothetical protein
MILLSASGTAGNQLAQYHANIRRASERPRSGRAPSQPRGIFELTYVVINVRQIVNYVLVDNKFPVPQQRAEFMRSTVRVRKSPNRVRWGVP